MRIGFGAPVSGAWATPANLASFAGQAEAAGYASLWTFQRLIVPEGSAMEPVYHSVLDPMVALGYAAAATSRIRLAVAVVNMPYLSPAYLAKQAATVDVLSGGRRPRISGHEASQDGERVVAVLACGVDVAADIEPVLGGVFAGEPAGYLLLSFQRPDAALADVVRGPYPGVAGEPEHVVLPVTAEFEQVTSGTLGSGVLRFGAARNPGPAGQHRVPELLDRRARGTGRDLAQASVTSIVPGLDQAAQRPLRLDGPDRAMVGLGGVLEVTDEMSQARLVPGQVLPAGVEVVRVPV